MSTNDPGHRSPEKVANIAILEAHVAAYNAQVQGRFDRFFAEKLEYEGFSPWAPDGITTDYDGIKEMAMAVAVELFPDRTMKVERHVAKDDTIAMETVWMGTATERHPTMKAG